MEQLAIRTRLEAARGYWRLIRSTQGSLEAAGTLLFAFVLLFHVDRWVVLSIEARIGAWFGLAAIAAAFVIFRIVRPLVQTRTDESIAIDLERRYPELRERLLSAVEFAGLPAERRRGMSTTLIDDLSDEAAVAVGPLDVRAAFPLLGLQRAALSLGIVVLLLGAHTLLWGPAFSRFVARMGLSQLPVWRDTQVQVSPLRTRVLKGSDFVLSVDQEGRAVDRARVHYQFGGGRWNRLELKGARGADFSHRFSALTESMTYYATAGDGVSDRGIVEAVDPAAIIGARLRLDYPPYMEKAPTTLTADSGGVAAPVGARVFLELRANKPLARAEARVLKEPAKEWPVRGDHVSGQLLVRQTGSYSLRLKDTDGFTAPDEQSFPIKAIPDQAPEVQLLAPGGDIDVAPDARVRLVMRATDDYGVDQIRVRYGMDGRSGGVIPTGRGGRKERVVEQESLWELGPMALNPGMTVRYRVEATDFDTVSGPHVSQTPEFQLRVLDRLELQSRYEQQRQEILAAIQELIREQGAVRSEVVAESRAQSPNADRLANSEDRQRTTGVSSTDLARRVNELARMAETNRLVADNELGSQRQASRGLERLGREAMPQAANRIGSAETQASSNPSAARSELSQAAGQQQQILNELRRIAEQMRPGSELRRLADRFDQLAQQQRELQAAGERMLPQTLGRAMEELPQPQQQQLRSLADQQRELQRATSRAIQDLEQAGRNMQAGQPQQARAAQETAQGLRQAQVPETQSQAAQNAQQNSLGQASSQQQQAAQELQRAAQNLRDALNPNDPRQLQRELRQAINRLNRLMQEQRDQNRAAQASMSRAAQQQAAQEQRALEQRVRELARQLERLQRRSPSAGQAAQNLNQAAQDQSQASQSLSQGRQQQAQQQQREAQRQLQRAMESLQQAMAEAGGEEDPFAKVRETLRRLVTRQKAVRDATRRIEGEQSARGAQPQHPEELNRLSAQQAGIQDDTRALQPDLPGDVFRNFIDEASKAMSRSRDLLAQGNPRANPTQRQQARAQSLLEQLEKAFDDSDDPTRQGGGGGGGGQGGAGQQDQELLRRMAEVRLLRSMQRMIRAQTQSIDDARSSETPLTPDQQEDVKDTAESQRSARQMADRLTQALQRYRNLQQRVQQAGKHMAEAQRGLERQNTGEAVQEHESQAIVRLNEALTRMQQRAQQQQQQQQRQQQQRQAGQMPQGGQPQTGQQQQGGSQPAMRSLARRTGVQSGALGTLGPDARGFGGLDSRGLDALRSGAREKGPAEFQDLIRRYYSGLTERGR